MARASHGRWPRLRAVFAGEHARLSVALGPGGRALRFLVLVYRRFDGHRCYMRASALAFNTLLALIPMLALSAGIAARLVEDQGKAPVKQFVTRLVAQFTPATSQNDPEALALQQRLTQRIQELIDNFRDAGLGFVSTLLFLYLALRVFNQLENSFNDLWHVPQPRHWYSRLFSYLPAILLGPAAFMLALTLTNHPTVQAAFARLPLLPGWLMLLTPFPVAALANTILYRLMPNTRVRWRHAFIGGAVAGFLWQLNHLAGALYISRIVINHQIYGSLGLIPVFMISLYISWLTVLFGAQIAAYLARRPSA